MYTLLAACAFILLYGWSSRIGMPRPARLGAGRHTGFWKHHEGRDWLSWVRHSTVCGLGVFSWVAWSCAVLVLLAVPAAWSRRVRVVLVPLLVVTLATMGAMNVPLLLRSLPALAVLAYILVSDNLGAPV